MLFRSPWGSTPVYLLWAPQGLYLNVLDPVFTAVPFPAAHEAQRGIFDGSEPDVPWLAASALNSEFVAFSTATTEPRLSARLASDPRVRPLYRQVNALYQLLPGANSDFVLDWQVLPPQSDLPPSPELHLDPRHSYPRAAHADLEGYVDLRRLGPLRGCVAFAHDLQPDGETTLRFELAPYGPTVLWLDQRLVASVAGELGAVLGQGIELPIELPEGLEPGRHRLTVLTCPNTARNQGGFYLLRRRDDRAPAR